MQILWNHWKRKILDSQFWCEHQDDAPEDFWPALLNLEDKQDYWFTRSNRLLKFIEPNFKVYLFFLNN